LVNVQVLPVESLEKRNDVPAAGLSVEKVVPHGFKNATPSVIL
jgi:hypothetical protein